MRPTFAPNNTPSLTLGYTESSPYFRLGDALRPKGANLYDLRFCHFCSWVGFARTATVRVPSFVKHVTRIIGTRTQEKMIWIATWRIVTFMANEQAVRDRPSMNFIRDAMCSVGATIYAQLSVALRVECTVPLPTFIRLAWGAIHPKAFVDRCLFRRSVVSRDVAPGFALDISYRKVGAICELGRLTAAAHTQAARIRPLQMLILAILMTANVFGWFSAYAASLRVVHGDWLGLLPTTALAVTVRNFVRGIMGLHKNLQFLCQAAGHFAMSLRQLYWGCYRSNYSANGLEMQACPPESTD